MFTQLSHQDAALRHAVERMLILCNVDHAPLDGTGETRSAHGLRRHGSMMSRFDGRLVAPTKITASGLSFEHVASIGVVRPFNLIGVNVAAGRTE